MNLSQPLYLLEFQARDILQRSTIEAGKVDTMANFSRFFFAISKIIYIFAPSLVNPAMSGGRSYVTACPLLLLTFAMSLMILLVLICSTKVSEISDMTKS